MRVSLHGTPSRKLAAIKKLQVQNLLEEYLKYCPILDNKEKFLLQELQSRLKWPKCVLNLLATFDANNNDSKEAKDVKRKIAILASCFNDGDVLRQVSH